MKSRGLCMGRGRREGGEGRGGKGERREKGDQ